jgi:hypothetical protein
MGGKQSSGTGFDYKSDYAASAATIDVEVASASSS